MKRILFLVCALLLLVDLADDGYLGKVTYATPYGKGSNSFNLSSKNPDKIDLQFGLPPPKSIGSLHCWQYLLTSIEVGHTFTVSGCHLLSSSGGMPL
jgi:hypothetical protein